jgi:glycosyltransferase involved in cell wall biosynthesis
MDSMLAQTLANFEFLIINDGSKDNTIEIVESYDDPRIRFIHNEKNIGISATLNKGIQIASSELIARMDADDVSYPERLQKQYDLMVANPDCAMVSCYTRVISDNGEFIRSEICRDTMLYYNLHFECSIYHPTVMFRRPCVEAVNMYDIPYAEDFDLFWKLGNKFRIKQIEEVLLDYRVSDESTHLVHKKKEYDEALFYVMRRNLNFYFEKNVQFPEEYLYFFRYEFEPIIAKKKFSAIIDCMKWLTVVSKKIMAHPNPNNTGDNISVSYQNKVHFTFLYIKPHISKSKWVLLILLSNHFSYFYKILKKKLL